MIVVETDHAAILGGKVGPAALGELPSYGAAGLPLGRDWPGPG